MSEQPRLLLCCFDVLPSPTGLSRRITEYLKGLSDRFQVVVLSTKTPDHSHIERYHGARLLRVPVGAGDLQSRIQAFDRAVRRQLESEEYVIAHFFDPFGGYALCDCRSQYGFRLVYDAQTFPSQELRYTNPAVESDRRFLSKVRRQELYCLMNADAVICGSEVTRDWVLSLGAPPMSLHVFPQPVDLTPYSSDAVGRPDGSPMKLLHLGSQLPYQGIATLLRAMQLALRQADLRLMIVGPRVPDGQAPFDDLVSELKLTGKVEFLPPVTHDELPKTLATADVGMLTLDESDRNRAQGGPLAKAAEYLAAGRPIVAADLPVTRELIPEDARMLFPPGDFKALADILVNLARDAELRVKLGQAARDAAPKFDASTVRGKLLDLYGLLSTRGKVGANEGPGEVTELRKTGSSDTSTGRARVRGNDAPGETLDEEAPPVVVGQQLENPERPEDRLRAAVTEPGAASPGSAPEPTPIVKARKKKKGGTDEHTPIRPPPEAQNEPTPITSARSRRVISKSAAKAVPVTAPPAAPVEAPPPPPVAEAPPAPIKRTTEGKGIRSPVAPPPPEPVAPPATNAPPAAVTAEVPPPVADAPVRIKRTSEGKGIRSPFAPPPAAPPAPPPPVEAGPSVIVEIDAGLPKLKRGDVDPLASRSTQQIPVLTPAPMPAVVVPPAPAPQPAPLTAPPAFDLPPIKRGPEARSSRPTEHIPVLTPQQPPPVAPGAPLIAPPVLPPLPPPPLPPPPAAVAAADDEPMEVSADDVESVEDEAPSDGLDPWLAQLFFGYCPPEAVPFERPAPPTNFPGRDT